MKDTFLPLINKNKDIYEEILSKIKEYKKIAIFRHIKPDFDALGTQFGLATWLKENFPDKDIKVLGDNHVTFTPRGIYPETDKVNDAWFDNFLAIIVDVGDKKRIADPRFERADFKIKLDHHPHTDNLFDIALSEVDLGAAAELVVNMLVSFGEKYKFSSLSANYFFTALVGDTGRFLFGSTSPLTFETAAFLEEKGVNLVPTYEIMYEKELNEIEFQKYVLNNYHITEAGTAYYVLKDSDLNALGIKSEQGKEYLNLFSSIKGVNIWCSISEDTTEPCFRISLRSRYYDVSKLAQKYKGGGHVSASGAQIATLDELEQFIKDCDELIKEGKRE